MPSLSQRGGGIVIKDNADKAVAYFPSTAGADMSVSPYGDSADEQRALAEGLVAQTGPRQYAAVSIGLAASTTYLVGLYLRRGTTLTNGWVNVGTNGTGLTLAKIGLWGVNGQLLVGSSDFSAALNAGAVWRAAQAPLPTPYTVPADGFFYAGIVQVGTTPALVVGLNGTVAANGLPGAAWPTGAVSGTADLASFTPPPALGPRTPWIGFS
jgi:hypothetical protein